MPVGIVAVGSYLPPDIVDNDTISAWTGVTPEWVLERTGYTERRRVAPGTATSDLAHNAVRDLLARHPTAFDNVRTLIVATSTPDSPQPATAVILKHHLAALPHIPAFDVNAVCAGWLYAVVVGAALAAQPATGPGGLVVGADIYSHLMDHTDRATVSLFGDGAGAALLGPVPAGFGILASQLLAHEDLLDLVKVPGGGSRRPLTPERLEAGEDRFRMRGRLVKDYVLKTLPHLVHDVLHQAGARVADVDRFVFHQANLRLIRHVGEILGADPARVVLTPRYGNTGAASIPIALAETHRERPLQRGELLLLAGVGGGMTAGAIALRWY